MVRTRFFTLPSLSLHHQQLSQFQLPSIINKLSQFQLPSIINKLSQFQLPSIINNFPSFNYLRSSTTFPVSTTFDHQQLSQFQLPSIINIFPNFNYLRSSIPRPSFRVLSYLQPELLSDCLEFFSSYWQTIARTTVLPLRSLIHHISLT